MKILFVQPPIEDFYDTSIRTYPLGLLYLASSVSDLCEVSVLDARTGFKAKPPEGRPPDGLEDYYRADRISPFSLFTHYRRFGMSTQAMARAITSGRPDAVAISSLFSTYSQDAIEIARLAKEIDSEIVTIVGGTHPTVFPAHVLSDPSVDFVIRGEGETPLRCLVEQLAEGKNGRIPEVCFKEGENLRIGPIDMETDMGLLPARSLVRAEKYRIGKKRYAALLTSRGCPNHCSFCGRPPVRYRKESLSRIEADIADCVARGIEAIDFQDDMLTGDYEFFHQVLQLFTNQGLTLSAMNGVYSEGLDEYTLDIMFEAGFRRLNFSLVDASDSLLSNQKRINTASTVRLLPYLESSSFLTEVHFIVGLPAQTPADVIETIILLMSRRLLLGPSIFYLAPGSDIFRRLAGEEWQPLLKSLRSSAMLPVNPLFPRPVTYTLIKLVRFINYMKGLLDREEISGAMSDCVESISKRQDAEAQILRTLLLEKRFIWQDAGTGDFMDEPQDHELVQLFFRMARGRTIKGFRTGNSLILDI